MSANVIIVFDVINRIRESYSSVVVKLHVGKVVESFTVIPLYIFEGLLLTIALFHDNFKKKGHNSCELLNFCVNKHKNWILEVIVSDQMGKQTRHAKMQLKRLKRRIIFIVLVTSLSFGSSIAAPFDDLSERHKQLIEELVDLTGKMPPFREKVRQHYHELIFVPTEKMFTGTILENDPQARNVMNEAIDSTLDREFDEGNAIKYVHYQSFGNAHYSEGELEELVKFYRTDVGKKTMDSMTELFKEWEKSRTRWATSLRSKIKREVKKRLNEYHQQRIAAQTASGPN